MEVSLLSIAQSGQAVDELKTEIQNHQSFSSLLLEVDRFLEAQRKTAEESRKEARQAEEKRMREKKIQDLLRMIATLRTQVSMGKENAAGQLAVLENQLFLMLLFGT